MNVALILAGGVDPGFQMDVPKQFVNVYNRPIIVYTMEAFQRHPLIDKIVIACLDGWQEMVKAYAKQFSITKLINIVPGGLFGQDSSYNATVYLESVCGEEDIVIIHDSIRPMVTEAMITDSIEVCRRCGMGVAAVSSMDTIMRLGEGRTGVESISRYQIMRIQTPQAYQFALLRDCHRQAVQQNIRGQYDTNSMMSQLGKTIYFSKGSDLNIKINTVEDVAMFKALYNMKKEQE